MPGRLVHLLAILTTLGCAPNRGAPAKDQGVSGLLDAGLPDRDAGDGDLAIGSGNEPPLTVLSLAPTNEDFFTPERGLLDQLDMTDSSALEQTRAAGHSLVWSYIRLDNYRASAIDAGFLSTLDAAFAKVRTLGMKVIVRGAYNFAEGDPDASLATVLGHIAQLKPILQKNGDVLAMAQAGFIGAWGEWHDSTNGLTTLSARQSITSAMLDAVPANRAVQIRYPAGIRDQLAGPLTQAMAYTGQPLARIGLHNDCFLASDDDFGTYDPQPIQPWKDYFAAQSAYTPVGGETCNPDPPRSECTTALAELAQFHYSWLNSDYEPNVLASWTSGGCMDTIRRSLGYRLVAASAAVNLLVRPGGVLDLTVALRNDGFAAPFNPRPVYVALLGADGSRANALLADVDPRRWAAGATTSLDVRLRVPAATAPGTYRLALWMPDAAAALQDRVDYALRLANAGVWDAVSGLNVLTTALVVTPDAPGAVDPMATTFAQIQ